MQKNGLIEFNETIWGYDFKCENCAFMSSTTGEAPLSAMDAMKEKGWDFEIRDTYFIPHCPNCKGCREE